MSDKFDPTLAKRKIFPRNLTAFASTVVRGNPANARPESGVDNTHPGLEFDQRNLDKSFFPGLVFEFQFLHGARLVEVRQELFNAPVDLGPADTNGDVYLYYVYGAFGLTPDQPRLVELHRTDGRSDGYEVLRTVHDLEPGRIMVVVGTRDSSDLARLGPVAGMEFAAALQHPESYIGPLSEPPPEAKVYRDPATGKLLAAILVGNRADYLDARGVIAAGVVPPGDLTRSLCAPWQWDFADCGCHYWASNKPDIVIGPQKPGDPVTHPDQLQILNFQRRDRTTVKQPATTYDKWTSGEITQQEMIRDWESLHFVIAEQETTRAKRPALITDPKPWTKKDVIDELRYLATIEHALSIEYLYAFYSIAAPRDAPSKDASSKVRDLFTAAQVVRSIAVDEMRHFRWANEALQILGADICLDRADNFNPKNKPNRICGHFQLRPLTKQCLDDFIRVEAPSRSFDQPDRLDGLYTHMLRSLSSGTIGIADAERQRVAEIVKLIIDEGHEHWERFERVKKLLAGYKEEDYLRVRRGPPDLKTEHLDSHLEALILTGSWAYGLILNGIREAFHDQRKARASHITDARLTMYSLDDIGQELADRGIGMCFDLPSADQQQAALEHAKNSKSASARELALRQASRTKPPTA